MSVPLNIVAAIAQNGVIGRNNALPWRLKSDLKRFREVTTGHPVIMGRSTYESIGRPLPGREIVVLSRDPRFVPEGVWVASAWDRALKVAEELAAFMGADAIMVAGGSAVFERALEHADRIYLTVVHHPVDGDTDFPAFDFNSYEIRSRFDHEADANNEYPFTFLELERTTG
jgi:dihydrofolate reductase